MKALEIKVGPQYFEYAEGAIARIPELLDEYKAKNILIVHGTISWEKAKPKLSFLEESPNHHFYYHQYTGECSYFGAELVTRMIDQHGIDFVIGVGGGKLADLVGYSSHLANVPFGIVPTLASNCAPWAPLSVMYKESGEAEGKTEYYKRQAAFLITDPHLVIDAPVSYFIAGLADTLAKWYESECILSQEWVKEEPFLLMAKGAAQMCREPILENYQEAIKDMKMKKVSNEFIQLSEIIFGVAGLVGGLGDKYARNAAAHAMHDAMSKYIEKSHEYLHGEKVAYGIFYQLALEEKWSLIDELLPLYKNLNLPVSLKDMGIILEEDELMDALIGFIDTKEKVHLLPIKITKERLRSALIKLEEYMVEK
ncbi:hypothetical protein IGI37_003387 [Enterococcus sp. AZ194]|uniref:iron-containing alcohol dehydrogenase family protein n=1 Tax=Enterococcus sp. AZ194 TaxID=2774629 RepID=UPI003F28994D